MTDPISAWTVTLIKDFIWVPFFTILSALVAYFHKRHEKHDAKSAELLESLNLLREEILKLEFKAKEIETSVLSPEDVNNIFKDKLSLFSHSLGEISTMVDLISQNLKKHAEKNIRQEEQIKTLARDIDRVREDSNGKKV